jgi:hypothetical protein
MDTQIKRLLSLLFLLLFVGCGYKVNIMGVDVTDLKDKDPLKVFAGAVVSVAAHEAAHYFTAQARGTDIEMITPIRWETPNERDEWVQNAGFVAQTGVGFLLNYIPYTKGSDFALGWNSVATAQLYTYGQRNGDAGDFEDDYNDNWKIFTALSTFNLGQSLLE